MLSGEKGAISGIFVSLGHSSQNTYPNKPFLCEEGFLIFFFPFLPSFSFFPFPFSPSFLKCFFQEQSSRPGLLTVGGDGVEWLDVGGVALAGSHC